MEFEKQFTMDLAMPRSPALDISSTERRRLPDRRGRPTGLHSCIFSPGRRRLFRRSGEGLNRYADHLRLPVVFWVLGLMGLSIADAALTLIHIQLGGTEVVPTMRWALDQSIGTFLFSKLSLTALGGAYLAVHQNFPIARLAYRTLAGAYGGLMVYHLILVLKYW